MSQIRASGTAAASRGVRASASSRAQRGGTIFGVIAGLLVGLLVAAAVAVYITKSPVPFIDRASRGPDPSVPNPGFAPDPNRSLYGRDAAAGLPPSGPVATPPVPVPTPAPAPVPEDGRRQALDQLIANLPEREVQPAPRAARPEVRPAETRPESRPQAAPAGRYMLQVGSFRVVEDAEALKAKIAFLGFDVRLQQAMVNGVLMNRVQVGPFAKLDDMNRARARLAENKVEAAVVRN
jgi:cell division protein FtsN